jgi:RNA polymerase sigma-70 factor (ECF subfamily)
VEAAIQVFLITLAHIVAAAAAFKLAAARGARASAAGADTTSLASRLDAGPPRIPAAGGRGQEGPRGRRVAFRRIFRPETLREVWRWLEKFGVTARDRGDVSQDVFLEALRSLRTYDRRRGSPEGWLKTIAFRRAARHWNRPERRREELRPDPASPEQADPEPNTRERIEREEERRFLLGVLKALPRDRRVVLIAYYVDGLPMTEVAARLGISVQVANKRRDLAIKAIRSAFAARDRAELRAAAVAGRWGARLRAVPAAGGEGPAR